MHRVVVRYTLERAPRERSPFGRAESAANALESQAAAYSDTAEEAETVAA